MNFQWCIEKGWEPYLSYHSEADATHLLHIHSHDRPYRWKADHEGLVRKDPGWYDGIAVGKEYDL